MSLDSILTVLVNTHHPGNIGSTARALKTMGLSKLGLVQPLDFPHEDADKLAASATDVLHSAQISDDLESLLQDTQLVVACTARPRGFDLPELNAEESAKLLLSHADKGKVAVLYGPERYGLSNEHLKLARYRVTIPANPEYTSLNLASAVQLMSYEIFKAYSANNAIQAPTIETPDIDLPSTEAIEQFYEHLETTLQSSGFIIKQHPGKIMDKLRYLFTKAELDNSELRILRGILASLQK